MSQSIPSYIAALPTGDSVSRSSSMLTPPLTPQFDHEIPYKPPTSDRISLNQKKKHRHENNLGTIFKHRRVVTPMMTSVPARSRSGRNSCGDMQRSQSEIILRRRSTIDISPHGTPATGLTVPFEEDRGRRWTLPSKSRATRAVTEIESTVKHAVLKNKRESPAMITLRRATTNKTRQGTNLTFFPEPTFEKQTSGILDYLISSLSGTINKTQPFCLNDVRSRGNLHDRPTGIPIFAYAAPTVCTEVTVRHENTMPGDEACIPPKRRCSSRYVSNNQTFEVIWDENDSLTSSHDTSRPSTAEASTSQRRSLAVEKLEVQIAKSEASSPKSSAQVSKVESRRGSYTPLAYILDSKLLVHKLSQTFSRLANESALQNVPRSKARRTKAALLPSTLSESVYHHLENVTRQRSTASIEFFPPLQSQRGLGQRARSVPLPLQHLGLALSVSSHVRRRRTTQAGSGGKDRSTAEKWLFGIRDKHHNLGLEDDTDTAPLLDKHNERRMERQKGYSPMSTGSSTPLDR